MSSIGSPLAASVDAATRSVEVCSVVGGSLLTDPATLRALLSAVDRGLSVRLLFPTPQSPWLLAAAQAAGTAVLAYRQMVVDASMRAQELRAEVRWYDAPGPCWFTLIDRALLYWTSITFAKRTWPTGDDRPTQVQHFCLVFDQLWARSVVDYRSQPSSTESAAIVRIVQAAPDILLPLGGDPRDLASLTPERFELLVADRLSAMGLGVKCVGITNQRDGGIDILAWPQSNAPYPYLLAVQVKHSAKGRPVGSGPVRDLRGAMSLIPADIGVLVTNTRFTADARWAAVHGPRIIRLRDFEDLVRWVRADFAHEGLFPDLPSEILLGPGIRIQIGSRGTELA